MCDRFCYTRSGEECICAGICIQLPCIDNYAPSGNYCCCIRPKYRQLHYDFHDFFNQVLPNLRTGDIVLASWPLDNSATAMSRCMQHSMWSHVGMVYVPSESKHLQVRDTIFKDSVHPSRPLIVQMTGGALGERAYHYSKKPGGFDAIDFEVWAKDYLDQMMMTDSGMTSSVAIRHLNDVERDDEFYKRVEAAVTVALDKPFEVDQLIMMKSQLDCCQCIPCNCLNGKTRTQKMWCSSFVGYLYIEMGLVSNKLANTEFTPTHFDSTRNLILAGGASLSDEHVVTGPESLDERHAMGYPTDQYLLTLWAEKQQKRQKTAVGGNNSEGDGNKPAVKRKFSVSSELGAGGFWQVDVTQPIYESHDSKSNQATSRSKHLRQRKNVLLRSGPDPPRPSY